MFRNCICNIIQVCNCISAWPLPQLRCTKFHKDSDNVILFPIEYSHPYIDSTCHKINTILGLNEPWTSSIFCPPTHKITHITWLKGENAPSSTAGCGTQCSLLPFKAHASTCTLPGTPFSLSSRKLPYRSNPPSSVFSLHLHCLSLFSI